MNTNYDKNRDKIIALVCKGECAGVNKYTNILVSCQDLDCMECLFYKDFKCIVTVPLFNDWCNKKS